MDAEPYLASIAVSLKRIAAVSDFIVHVNLTPKGDDANVIDDYIDAVLCLKMIKNAQFQRAALRGLIAARMQWELEKKGAFNTPFDHTKLKARKDELENEARQYGVAVL
jgi:hypothetical protein